MCLGQMDVEHDSGRCLALGLFSLTLSPGGQAPDVLPRVLTWQADGFEGCMLSVATCCVGF